MLLNIYNVLHRRLARFFEGLIPKALCIMCGLINFDSVHLGSSQDRTSYQTFDGNSLSVLNWLVLWLTRDSIVVNIPNRMSHVRVVVLAEIRAWFWKSHGRVMEYRYLYRFMRVDYTTNRESNIMTKVK